MVSRGDEVLDTGVDSEGSRISVMMGLSSLLGAILQVEVAFEQASVYRDQYRVIMTGEFCCYDKRALLNVVCAGIRCTVWSIPCFVLVCGCVSVFDGEISSLFVLWIM